MLTETAVQANEFFVAATITDPRWKENCYIVQHQTSREQVLIDPGDRADAIMQAIADGGGQLRHILLTHTHFDHVGAAAAISKLFGLPCRLHKDDVRLLHHAPMYALRFAGKSIEMPVSYQALDDKPLQFGEQTIEVIHTPGHTRGSVCYQIGGLLFTGDTLLRQRVGRTDLPGGDPVPLKESINRLLTELPEDTPLFPGHGRPWTIGEARAWWSAAAASSGSL
jgi:hydroxyacylglutathione hydrolase